MAIKISNITVIDDSRNLLNANTIVFASNTLVKLPAGGTASRPVSPANGSIRYNTDENIFEGYAAGEWGPVGAGIPIIQTPTNTSPANGEANVAIAGLTLAATNFRHIYNKPKASGTWQLSTSPTFSSFVFNDTVAGTANSYTPSSANVSLGTTLYWRVKYADGDGNETNFSTPTSFTITNPPSVLGESYGGGYYTGTIDIGGGVCYYLIVAPNATGCAQCQYRTAAAASPGAESCYNGYTNTYPPLENATHPAGNFTATRTINGFSDWYMPSRFELSVMHGARNSMPPGEGYRNVGFTVVYWSSTQGTGICICRAFHNFFGPGGGDNTGTKLKTESHDVRAIRRIPV